MILVLTIAALGVLTPGPGLAALTQATLAGGLRAGLAFAGGMTLGSLAWSLSTAFGLNRLLLELPGLLPMLHLFGAAYLSLLAVRAVRAAIEPTELQSAATRRATSAAFAAGFAIHVSNPKAILFFTSVFSILVADPTNAPPLPLAALLVSAQTGLILVCLALVMSRGARWKAGRTARRVLSAALAAVYAFGAGALVWELRR